MGVLTGELPLLPLSSRGGPGNTMAGGRASLMEATESSALAIRTCWQTEMEKKTNTHWATILGRELYLFSFNLHASLEALTLWTRKGA